MNKGLIDSAAAGILVSSPTTPQPITFASVGGESPEADEAAITLGSPHSGEAGALTALVVTVLAHGAHRIAAAGLAAAPRGQVPVAELVHTYVVVGQGKDHVN